MVDTALSQQQQALLLEPTPDLVGEKSWVVHNGEKKTIGRKAECDIVVNDTIVSGQHCTVGLSILSTQERQGDGIVISVEDKSTNGTLINGEKVGKGKIRYAQVGDVISLGKPKITSQGEHCYAASYKLRMVMLDSMGRWQEKENIKNANSEGSSTDAPVGSPRSAVHSEAITTREALGSVPRLRNFPVNGKRAREPPTGARRREGKTSSAAAMAAAHREEQLRAQLASVEEARRKEESRATELEIRVRVNEERLRALTEQLEEARKGKDRFQAENADLQNQIAELTIRGKQLEAAAESKERAWQDSQREAGMRNEEMESLRAEAYEAAARARDVTRRLRDVKRSYDTTVEANRKLMEYSTELKERVDGLQAALVTSSSSVGALQNAIQHLFDVSREHDGQETAK
ncbi:hypothetical protein Pmar_PMAR006825 [Perkinsus marinus ATCC 50983]|uniref:FHA domain-containing protein n=1 Tax=Perkinsus marinus (strain ATCC 50983 / TXsc) TaxID=423536 RepID=C5K6L1_PERM5|nr:hypothetical protein Pmar_PMAR006825 [Perkinsus marinus ATCC 50983]EER19931.1 hypothetical protein Pmar_PMAR006825 [Perkinsus marinus ATCC 50983]|eukprot:XP_002788135.1 hypothetical protein Pmar_PMAR006825 [Perkinsus marinus ATCC 50983]